VVNRESRYLKYRIVFNLNIYAVAPIWDIL